MKKRIVVFMIANLGIQLVWAMEEPKSLQMYKENEFRRNARITDQEKQWWFQRDIQQNDLLDFCCCMCITTMGVPIAMATGSDGCKKVVREQCLRTRSGKNADKLVELVFGMSNHDN